MDAGHHLIEKYGLAPYADLAEVVALDAPFVTELLKAALPYREGHRLKLPDRPDGHGLLFPNYHCHREGADAFYSIEIKVITTMIPYDLLVAQVDRCARICKWRRLLFRATLRILSILQP